MNVAEFKRVLTAFADNPADVDLSKGRLLVQIRDDVIAADVETYEGSVWIIEDEVRFSAYAWIVERIARIPHLADRILTYIDDVPYFVTPSGQLLEELEQSPDDKPVSVADASLSVRQVLARRPAGMSSILYLT